jgi:uncharacterized protein with gpF-like domain
MIVKADPDIDRLLSRLEPSVRRAVTELLTRGKVNVSEIAALLEAGRVGEAIQALGIGFDDESMSAVREALRAAFSGGAKPVAAEFGLRFDVFDEHAVRWAEANAGRLITEINDETRRAVAGMVEQAVRDGVPPRRLARTIEQTVGLHTRYAQAVHNYKEGLLAQVTEQRAEELAGRYARRLLRKRAETIARTETIRAMSEGQLDGWREAADEGVLQTGRSQREWVVTTDDRLCPECAPMEGQIVAFTDAFVSSEVAEGFSVTPGYEDRVTITGTKPRVSNVTTMTPPLHPNCRCAVSLVFDVD